MPGRRDEVGCVWSSVVDRARVGVRVTPNAVAGVVVGAGYLLAGVVAIAVALGTGMATSPGHPAAGPGAVHCCAYLAVGAVLVLAAGLGHARAANTLVGAGYLVLGVTLLLRDGGPQLLALNHPDAVVHLSSAAVLLGFGRTQE